MWLLFFQFLPTEAQELAADVCADFDVSAGSLHGWSTLGNAGSSKQNCRRDWKTWGKTFGYHIEGVDVKVPYKNRWEHNTTEQQHRCLLPIDSFAGVYHSGQEQFNEIFLGGKGEEGLREYWDSQSHCEWVQEHPGLKGVDPGKCIPYGLHADKGQYFGHP
jgi:hypothetical protein